MSKQKKEVVTVTAAPSEPEHAGLVGGSEAHAQQARIVGKPRRLPRQSMYTPPSGAKPEDSGQPLGFGRSVVSVAVVARDWGISARRVRTMLADGRLVGRQLENGYWEVSYPYSYVFGTRGPQIKRQRNLPPAAPRERKERFSEW